MNPCALSINETKYIKVGIMCFDSSSVKESSSYAGPHICLNIWNCIGHCIQEYVHRVQIFVTADHSKSNNKAAVNSKEMFRHDARILNTSVNDAVSWVEAYLRPCIQE